MRNSNTAEHPIEVALVLAWLVAEALLTVLVVGVALVVVLLAPVELHRAAPAPAAPAPAAPPAEAPLAALAAACRSELEAVNVAQLRRRARAAGLPRPLTRSGRKSQLLDALASLEVALI